MGDRRGEDMGRQVVLRLIACAALAAPFTALTAQGIPRPRLDPDADTLDARAYWSYGNQPDITAQRLHETRYWAWRLTPDETDYLYGVYDALWFQQSPQWRRQFREGVPSISRSRAGTQLDSLYPEILLRDPFPHLAGPCVLPRGIDDLLARDPVFAAAALADNNCHTQAAESYERAIRRTPDQLWLRLERARSLVFEGQYRAGTVELRVILDSLRTRDEHYFSRVYQSKAMLEYMVGVTLLRAADLPGARAALGQALTDDLTFWPAHARLGDVAAAEGDLTEAAGEYELAVGLRDNDGVLRFKYGVVLLHADRLGEAETQLREAIRLEPYWMEPYGQLAVCLDRQGRTADAVAEYRSYATRVPRRLARWRNHALARAAELEGAP